MGICISSTNMSPSATGNLSSAAGSSQSTTTTGLTTSSLSVSTSGISSNVSGNSQFSSASSGFDRGSSGQILPHSNLKIYTFSELKSATKNFRIDAILGEGGFGKVYKGRIDEKSGSKHNSNASVIAVKKLNSESMQGVEEWQAEVIFLGRLSHPNLVKLLGYCYEEEELLLVYEFMQRGSLENHLFGRGSTIQPLPWDIRVKIAIGAARGLAFLHTSDEKVIYRDFKASNILLDGSYNAKLSDFGLAKMASLSQSHVTTRVMGTHGYAAPEYVTTANRRKLKNIMDSRLEGSYPSKAACQLAQLALACLEPEPKTRPSMQEVVVTLEQLSDIKERPKVPRIQGSTPRSYGQRPLHHRSTIHVTDDVNRRIQVS
ncbi:hypothetical protein E3N88_02030 [Mikania micrantha]|uniref:non-specific serine/threonine protein kinase n=1 Tax=Mikania micrantha TaxID=192012 RepID=A0A5N6Q2N9_9ASTR|nr:hypothetical protein E3N88_02030 [Mikania micrantha]